MSNFKRTEMTFEEFCNVPLTYTHGIRFTWGALRLHRNDELGIQRSVVTHLKVKGDIYSGWEDSHVSYFLADDEREFETSDQLYVAYMEKVCGENQ